MKTVSIIIPARYDSTRFPGKPLALINNKPMILHVCDGCAPAFGKDRVYVTTDDDRIKEVVENAGYKVIMTTKEQVFLTGSDRVAYASQFVNSEYIISVQGDEPLVKNYDIESVYHKLIDLFDIVNCYKVCKQERGFAIPDGFQTSHDGINWTSVYYTPIENKNTIKVITASGRLSYMSRSPIPFKSDKYKKQVCIYGFRKNILQQYFGEGIEKCEMEECEDIEILRFINYGYSVRMIEVKNEYQSVDESSDIEKVEKILNDRN